MAVRPEKCPLRRATEGVHHRQQENQVPMRSKLVFNALHTLRNRYMLCQLASKATRRFHRPNTRIQETMNEVMERIAVAQRQQVLAEPDQVAEAQRRAA